MRRWLVVGGGTAGCVVAARIKQRTGDLVTLAEAGRDHPPVDGDDGPVLGDPSRLWTDCTVARRPGSAPEPYPQGYGLGGSSLVNGAVLSTGPDHPGVGHLLPTEVPADVGVLGRAVLAASDAAGPVTSARRAGRRVTTADAYVRPLRGTEHFYVRTATRVRRLMLDDRRIVGAVTTGGEELEAEHTVLCAGAIHTPAILLRTGIDTPGVGEGLQDHAASSIGLTLAPEAIDDGVPVITVAVNRPGRQITVVNHLPGDRRRAALLPALMSVASLGGVTLPDPDGEPVVELGQLTHTADRSGLVAVWREACALLDHPAMRSVVAEASADDTGTPLAQIAAFGDDRLADWLGEHLTGYYHLSGSCRMGLVTDELGHVRGYDGLSICDASLFRGVPQVGPYLPVVTMAERLSALWAAETP